MQKRQIFHCWIITVQKGERRKKTVTVFQNCLKNIKINVNLVDFVAVTAPYTSRTTKRLFILFWSVNPKHLSTYTSMSVPPQQSNTSATYWYYYTCTSALVLPVLLHLAVIFCATYESNYKHMQNSISYALLPVHVLNITSAAPSCYIHHIAIQNHCFTGNAECFKCSLSQSHNTHFGFCLRSFC